MNPQPQTHRLKKVQWAVPFLDMHKMLITTQTAVILDERVTKCKRKRKRDRNLNCSRRLAKGIWIQGHMYCVYVCKKGKKGKSQPFQLRSIWKLPESTREKKSCAHSVLTWITDVFKTWVDLLSTELLLSILLSTNNDIQCYVKILWSQLESLSYCKGTM